MESTGRMGKEERSESKPKEGKSRRKKGKRKREKRKKLGREGGEGRSEGEGRAREKDGGELRGVSCPLVQHSGMLLKEVCCVNRESFSGLLNAHRNMGPLNLTGEERHGSYLKGKKEEKRRKSYS